MSEFRQHGESLSPDEQRKQKIRENLKELQRRREAQELEQESFQLESIYFLQEMDLPLTKKELGKKAIVLSSSEFEELGYIEIVLPSGKTKTILAEDAGYGPDDQLIIFPEDLGDTEAK